MTFAPFKVKDLPDFIAHELLNKLRGAMGAELIGPISDLKIHTLTLDEILRTTGQDVDIEEVDFKDDGTFEYQGRRVILHIRDIQPYKETVNLPKFHLANCQTLQSMWQKKRSERYVVSTRQNGSFRIKLSLDGGATWENKDEQLDVCKFCLTSLDWHGYASAGSSQRPKIFSEFSLEEFFEKYKTSPMSYTPNHTDESAPINTYTNDFNEISKAFRSSKGWKCDGCGIDLSHQDHRKYLHVHHIDGSKHNNFPTNLEALCVDCHAKQDMHGHMENSLDVFEFRRLFRAG